MNSIFQKVRNTFDNQNTHNKITLKKSKDELRTLWCKTIEIKNDYLRHKIQALYVLSQSTKEKRKDQNKQNMCVLGPPAGIEPAHKV